MDKRTGRGYIIDMCLTGLQEKREKDQILRSEE